MTSAATRDRLAVEPSPAPEPALTCSFDYTQLNGDVAAEIRDAAERIRGFTRAAVIDIGRELLQVKEQLTHDQFIAWVEHECALQMRTAQRAMQAAVMVSKYDNLSYLPPDGLLALAKKSASQPVVAEVLQEIEAGGWPSAADIRQRLRDAKRTSNTGAVSPNPAALKPILRAWTKLEPADKEAALIALWGTLSPAQQAAFQGIIGSAPADALQGEAAVCTDMDVDIAVGTGGDGDEPSGAESSAAAALMVAATSEDHAVTNALVSGSPPATHRALVDEPIFREVIEDPLEAAYAALLPEQQVNDRDRMMRRLAQGEPPPADPSPFLQLYLSAQNAEQKAFRARRVAEPTSKAA